MKRIPDVLVISRATLGPVILIGGLNGWSGSVLVALLLLATITDIVDGFVARRMQVTTEWLRRADSLADTIFYLFVVAFTLIRFPGVLRVYGMGIAAVVLLELIRVVFDQLKFGKQAAYHMWSAKAWGIALFLGFAEVFLTGQGGLLFTTAILLGILTDLEGLASSVVLPEWNHDVPTIYHAVTIRRSRVSSDPDKR